MGTFTVPVPIFCPTVDFKFNLHQVDAIMISKMNSCGKPLLWMLISSCFLASNARTHGHAAVCAHGTKATECGEGRDACDFCLRDHVEVNYRGLWYNAVICNRFPGSYKVRFSDERLTGTERIVHRSSVRQKDASLRETTPDYVLWKGSSYHLMHGTSKI